MKKRPGGTSITNGIRQWDWLTIPAAVILGIVIAKSSMLPMMMYADTIPILDGLQNSMILDLTAYLLPVLVCLPGVMRMYEERSGGYDIYHMFRVGRNKYVVLKLWQSMLCGAKVMIGACLIYTGYALIRAVRVRKPLGFESAMVGNEATPTIYYIWMKNGLGALVFVVNILFLIVLAMFWNIVGTTISIFIVNRRVAVVAPFLFKRFLEYLIPERLFFLNPANLRMSAWVDLLPWGGIWYGILYILLAFLIGWIVIFAKLSVEAVSS